MESLVRAVDRAGRMDAPKPWEVPPPDDGPDKREPYAPEKREPYAPAKREVDDGGRDCIIEDFDVGPRHQSDLRRVCGVNLGWFGRVSLRRNYSVAERKIFLFDMQTTRRQMRQMFMPHWEAKREGAAPGFGWSEAMACLDQGDPNVFHLPGAEFSGGAADGFVEKAAAYALITLYSNADLLGKIESIIDDAILTGRQPNLDWAADNNSPGACGMSAAMLREALDAAEWRVKLFSDSKKFCGDADFSTIQVNESLKATVLRVFETDSSWSGIAYTPSKQARMCPGWSSELQQIDYYLMHAHRLYELLARGLSPEPLRDLFIGQLCARMAMAAMVNFAGIVLHEFAHITGRWNHCHRGQHCCHFLTEYLFRVLMTSRLGLPLSHNDKYLSGRDLAWDPASGPFRTSSWSQLYHNSYCPSPDTAPFSGRTVNEEKPYENKNVVVIGEHDSMLGIGHRVDIRVQFMADCTSADVDHQADFSTVVQNV